MKAALIVAVPPLTASAVFPFIVAADVLEEFQTAELVRFCVLPSLKLPVAKKALAVPGAMDVLTGVTARETSVAEVTVRVVDAVREPTTAVMVVVPGCFDTARLPFMLATDVLEEDQVALFSVCVLPSS